MTQRLHRRFIGCLLAVSLFIAWQQQGLGIANLIGLLLGTWFVLAIIFALTEPDEKPDKQLSSLDYH